MGRTSLRSFAAARTARGRRGAAFAAALRADGRAAFFAGDCLADGFLEDVRGSSWACCFCVW